MSTSLFSRTLLDRLARARSVVAFTGAGISAESGVPTFRGTQGIWTKFKPEELASMNAFLANPALVWEWYSARKKIFREVSPNDGHRAIAHMEPHFQRVTVVTQNIDNLHVRAGSSHVFELHGNIERNYCLECGMRFVADEIDFHDGIATCNHCSGMVRPDVVWFGETIPVDQWNESVRAIESADVVLSIGTSGVVYPAAELPLAGKYHGAYLLEVNPEETELSGSMDETIRERASFVLPRLLEAVRNGS